MQRVINFMGIRHVAVALTLLLTLVSIGALAVKGLNFGLDFTGGTLIELGYEKPADLQLVRRQMAEIGYGDATVQSFGAATDVLVRLQGDDPQLGKIIVDKLQALGGDNAVRVKRVEFVGPAVGEELREDGGMAMLLALMGILIYVAFRFQWKFGAGAIISLVHDVIVTLGVFALFQIPFDLTVLAAVLAIIGYSLNDTIVVFDRIRENMRILRKTELIDNINISTTQTLLRTMATSISTLLAVLALMLFAGESLWGFSLALLIGVGAGTYSSIYIAAIALVWRKLTPEDLIPPPPSETEVLDETP